MRPATPIVEVRNLVPTRNAGQNQSGVVALIRDEFGNDVPSPESLRFAYTNATSALVSARSSTATLEAWLRSGRVNVYDLPATRFEWQGLYALSAEGYEEYRGTREFEVQPLGASKIHITSSSTAITKGDDSAFIYFVYQDRYNNATSLTAFATDMRYVGISIASTGTLALEAIPEILGAVRARLSTLKMLGNYDVSLNGSSIPLWGTTQISVVGREAAFAEIWGLPFSSLCESNEDIDITVSVRDIFQEPTNAYPNGIRYVVTRNGQEIEQGNAEYVREISLGMLQYRLRAPFTPGLYTLSLLSSTITSAEVTGNVEMDVCPDLVPSITLNPHSLTISNASLSGGLVQTYTLQYQNTNTVTIILPPGFFVRVENFGVYQSGAVTLPTPNGTGMLTLQLLYEPALVGLVNVNISHQGIGASLSTPVRNLSVVVSVIACPVVRDTVTILPVFSQTAQQNLIDIGNNIRRYLLSTYDISNPVFRNSGVNNVMIRFTHPEGVIVGDNNLFMSNSQIVNARAQARADVVAFYNHNGHYDAPAIGAGRNFDLSYFRVDSRGDPLTYITMHEVGHVLYGAHEFGASTGFDQNDRYPDGRGITQWVHRISPTGVWSAFYHGTMLFHGQGITWMPPVSERVPFFSNPNISIEVRADADVNLNVQMNGRRTIVMGAASANMARVIAIEGPIVANQFPTLLSVAILGSDILPRGSSGQYTAQVCSNRDLRYEWSIRPVRTVPDASFQLVGTDPAFSLLMLQDWTGVIVRVRVFDVASGIEVGSDTFFVRCGSCNDIPVALSNEPKNGASLSSALSEAVAGQATITDQGLGKALIQGLVLEPNFPNPFSQETEIAFVIPATTAVRLTLYDALGREVAVLLNGETHSRGRHTLKFNGSKLPSGVYSFHLQAGIWKTSRTLTIIR